MSLGRGVCLSNLEWKLIEPKNRINSVLEIKLLNLCMPSPLEEMGLLVLLSISCPGNLTVRSI